MSKYFEELGKKSDKHKRHFALLASGTITLFIFGVWSLATFGVSSTSTVATEGVNTLSPNVERQVGPIEALGANVFSGFNKIRNNFSKFKTGSDSLEF